MALIYHLEQLDNDLMKLPYMDALHNEDLLSPKKKKNPNWTLNVKKFLVKYFMEQRIQTLPMRIRRKTLCMSSSIPTT